MSSSSAETPLLQMDWGGVLFGEEPEAAAPASEATPAPIASTPDVEPEATDTPIPEAASPIVEVAQKLVETLVAEPLPEEPPAHRYQSYADDSDPEVELAEQVHAAEVEATPMVDDADVEEIVEPDEVDVEDVATAAEDVAIEDIGAEADDDFEIEDTAAKAAADAEPRDDAVAEPTTEPAGVPIENDLATTPAEVIPATATETAEVIAALWVEPAATSRGVDAYDAPPPIDDVDPFTAFDRTFTAEPLPAPPPLPQHRPAPTVTTDDLELPPPLPPYTREQSEPDTTRRYRERVAPERGPKSKGVIGIDLGTTYSCAAIVEDGKARMLASRQGGPSIASVVRYAEDGRTVVGGTAARNASRHPESTILGSKRLMGRAFTSPVVQDVQHHFAYDVVSGRDGEAAIRVGDEIIALEDVAASILEEIREAVGLQLEATVNRAVITCPAHFTEPQREAVRRAGELAGFYVERVLNEPTAAALNYAASHHIDQRRVVVYDLGGGTFDVSVLEVAGDVFEVLATGGDSFLGGLDFDACVVEMLSEALLEQDHIDAREDPAAIAKLFEFAERAKRDLSERPSTIVQIDHLVVQPYAARALSVGLRRVTVERAFEPLVAQTLQIVEETVQRAGLKLSEIDDVVLVGGQSRAPIVRRSVEMLFGRPPLDRVDPEEAVALGAARYAASLDAIDAIVLIDALPLSIGVGLPGGRFKPLLSRDTRLPSSRTYQVRTTRDDQRDYEIALFQGESERVEDNEPLGILTLDELPKGPRGTVVIEVTLSVDAECVLDVKAREPTSGNTVAARMVTKGTAEELRVRLGLPAQPTHEELERRRQKKLDRPKKVWRWITGLFRRDR
ncbi:MAG: Hsp70 family protein [Deltaproteobacteria bacterium]